MTSKRSVLLVDSEILVRRGVRLLIDSFPDFEVAAEADNAEQALQLASRLNPDLVVTEVALEGTSGVELIHELHRQKSSARTLVLSRLESLDIVKKALMAGSGGYVFKAGSDEQFKIALESVIQGLRFLPPQIAQQIEIPPDLYALGDESEEKREDPLAPLSTREREIFFLLASGLRNCSIASKLAISPRTVETHRARIVEKLALSSNLHLVHYAFRHSLIVPLEK